MFSRTIAADRCEKQGWVATPRAPCHKYAICTAVLLSALACRGLRPITWTCVQRCRGCPHRPDGRNTTQPSAGRDVPQGPDRGRGDAARVVIRRPDGACGRRPRQGRAGHRLHLLLVEEPPDRRGLSGPDAPGALLHRRQRRTAERVEHALREIGADGRRRARGRRRVHDGTAGSNDPEVRSVRDRIGSEIHRRIARRWARTPTRLRQRSR